MIKISVIRPIGYVITSAATDQELGRKHWPSQTLLDRLDTWNRPAVARDYVSAQDFVNAFISSPDADGLGDNFDVIDHAARAYYARCLQGD
jgi:hypothetical protein